MRIIYLIILTVLLIGCGDDKEVTSIKGTHNNENIAFKVKVVVHDTKDKMRKAQDEYQKNESYRTKSKEDGWAGWNLSGTYCEIHVLKIKSVEDEHFETWGHELGHCVYGTFHPEA